MIGGLAVYFVPYWTENIRQGEASELIFGVILIVLMFVMPEGLMGLIIRLSRRILRIEPQPPARPGHRPGAVAPAPSDGGPTTVIDHDEERNPA